jgi:hypothetical protein
MLSRVQRAVSHSTVVGVVVVVVVVVVEVREFLGKVDEEPIHYSGKQKMKNTCYS